MSDFPPIASLRSFEAVARLGSVTLAAKELHVTHSAISQQIKLLEEMVGVKLFIRQGRGVQINEEGRLYALQVREALNHIGDGAVFWMPLAVAASGTLSGEISAYHPSDPGQPDGHQPAAGGDRHLDTDGERKLGRE